MKIEAASLLLYLTIMYRVISIMILTHLFVYFSDEDDGLAGEEESEVKHVKKRPKVNPPPTHTHMKHRGYCKFLECKQWRHKPSSLHT